MSLRRPAALALVLAAALGTGCRGASAAAEAGPAHDGGDGAVPVVTFLPQGVRVQVELALTPAEHARGLMFRKHLEDGHGMLFVFDDDEVRTFWMKNTLVPLDMIFVSKDHVVVGVVHEAEPLTLSPREVDAESRYVIEVPGGWARVHDVAAGTTVRFENVPG